MKNKTQATHTLTRRTFVTTAGLIGGAAALQLTPDARAVPGPEKANAPAGVPPAPYLFTRLRSRSISAENLSGAKGAANKWKDLPAIPRVHPGKTQTLADIEGPGMIRHIWLTFWPRTPEALRSFVLRIYWDGMKYPSVEAPVGDFFGLGHGRVAHFSTPYLTVADGRGFNSFFPMPFSKHCRITIENDSPQDLGDLYYQINYTLGDEVTEELGRFHAHFRRDRPARGTNFVLLDTKGTPGVYVGTTIACLPLEPGNWREGEFRFFIDGDKDKATIAGTGWSDWFLSAWGLDLTQSLYAGCTYQVPHPEWGDKYFCSCFRFHVLDPIYFQHDLRVEYQQIGHYPPDKINFKDRADDWCSTVYW